MKLAYCIIVWYRHVKKLSKYRKMKLLNVPFVIITISTIVGIVLGYYITIDVKTVLMILSIFICLLAISWQRSKKMFSKATSFTFLMIVVFIILGTTLVKIHHPENHSNHYTHQMLPKDLQEHQAGIRFSIKERLKPSSYYDKYLVSLRFLKDSIAEGTLLLQIPRDSIDMVLDIGAVYSTVTTLKPIPKPLNPYQFDYANYLAKHYVFHKITTSPNRLIAHDKVQWSVFRLADRIRKGINTKLSKYTFDDKQLSIINALLLGQRQDITQETFNEYRDAGAIHILAVSGLHVGILLLILNLVLQPLSRLHRKGKTITLVITIILLWCFAIIAGLSPSVLRAVTMFSFLAIGMQIRSKTSSYNSLFVSMFVLLCFNPLLLFSVGFQLSYLAVFAIVWIQPVFARWYRPTLYISKKLWDTFTVTMAAQLGLLPLTLYYFHQFPLLFFLSNLIIIPFLGGILGFGILVVLLASLEVLPQFVATLFGSCIDLMNSIIGWIARQDAFLMTGIPFSWRMLLILYGMIITTILVFQKYEKRRVYWMMTSMIISIFILLYEKHHVATREELIVFHNQQYTTLGVLQHQKLQLYSKDSISHKTLGFLLGGYLIQNQADLGASIRLKNVYQYKKQTVLVIDSASVYPIKAIHPDIILLSDSPKIHLGRIIDSLQPKQIVADASNYRSYLDRWEKNCLKLNIPFHRTDKKGAFIVK